MKTVHILYFFILNLFLACNSTKKTHLTVEKDNNSVEILPLDSIFGTKIAPEFVRLKGSVIKEIKPMHIKSTGVEMHFKVTDIIGYGSTFSKPLQVGDTIVAFTKFGYRSLRKSDIDSLNLETVFIADMEGNPIISNQYTIYKLQLIK